MKKIYFTLGLTALLFGANAQQFKITPNRKALSSNFHGLAKTQGTTIDTLVPASIADSACGANLTSYVWDNATPIDSGYIFGTGIFPQAGATVTAVAQKYKVTGAATVTDILILASAAHGGTVTTTANIYSDNTSSNKPGTILGTSQPVAMSALTTTALSTYHFASPVALTAGNFYANINLPNFGGADKDTLAVINTQQGCSSKDSLSLVKINANIWFYTRTLFGSAQAYDLDLAIFPVINITTAGIDKVTKGGLSLFAAYPNPANTTININFSLDKASKVDIEIYDISGKIVKTISNTNSFASGANLIGVDVSNLEAGSYLYSINAGGNKMFSRFVVTK